ncbi:MAG: hypothetical protein ACI8ZN_000621 [Bacteroidia bacterium]|jgi:hypothetical protein
MKSYITLIIISIAVLTMANKCVKEPNHNVSIQFTTTQSYCGGAAPPEYILQELATPKPYKTGVLYFFREGRSEADTAIQLDGKDNARVQLRLSPGTYILRLKDSISPWNGANNESEIKSFDSERPKCLHEYNQRVLAQFTISQDSNFTQNIHFDCNPCYEPAP